MGGRLAGDPHGGWRALLLALAVLLPAAPDAWAARPFTLDEQAHINVLRK